MKANFSKRICVLILGFGLWVFLLGQRAGSQEILPDYSRAFAHFRTLGLPDVKGTQYVKVSPNSEHSYYGAEAYSAFSSLRNLKLEGNGWLLSEDAEGKTFTAIVNGMLVKTFSREGDVDQAIEAAEWKPADLAKDVERLLKVTEDAASVRQFRYSTDLVGNFLFMAAHLQRSDQYTKEANALVASILTVVEDREKCIQSAVSMLADQDYIKIIKKYQKSQDIAEMANDCEKLVNRFGRGWLYSGDALRYVELLRSQPERIPPVVAPKGITLSAKHRELEKRIIDLKALPPSLFQMKRLAWIFPEAADEVRVQKNEDDQILLDIIEEGISSAPLLIALLGNEEHFLGFVSRSSGDFPKLMTLAEFAAPLAEGVLMNVDAYGSPGVDEVAAELYQWYAMSKGKDLVAIAREFQDSENDYQKEPARKYLYTHGTESDWEKIEQGLVAEAIQNSWSGFESISEYLAIREDASERMLDLLETEISAHLKQLEIDPDQKDQYESSKKNFEEKVKTLRAVVSPETAADLLAKVISGEENIDDSFAAIGEKLSKRPVDQAVETVVKTAASADDHKLSARILQLLRFVEERTEDVKLEWESLSEAWQTLLKKEPDLEAEDEEFSLALTAAWRIESLYAPEETDELRGFWDSMGSEGEDFILERARARISNETVPAFPRAEDVSEEEANALRTELLSMKEQPNEFRQKLLSLSAAEKLSVVGKRSGVDGENGEIEVELTELQKEVSRIQMTIAKVTVPEDWEKIRNWEGQVLTKKHYDDLIDLALGRAKEGDVFLLDLKAKGAFGPLEISVAERSIDDFSEEESSMTAQTISQLEYLVQKPTPVLIGSIGGSYYGTVWIPDENPEEEVDSETHPLGRNAERMRTSREYFRKQLDYYFQPAVALPNLLDYSFMGLTKEEERDED